MDYNGLTFADNLAIRLLLKNELDFQRLHCQAKILGITENQIINVACEVMANRRRYNKRNNRVLVWND
jgi:hypothetical protein